MGIVPLTTVAVPVSFIPGAGFIFIAPWGKMIGKISIKNLAYHDISSKKKKGCKWHQAV